MGTRGSIFKDSQGKRSEDCPGEAQGVFKELTCGLALQVALGVAWDGAKG